MGVPMGAPMGVPMGVPMGAPMGVPMGADYLALEKESWKPKQVPWPVVAESRTMVKVSLIS